ncbi:phage tailspike protein [Shimwellia blattae]|uniref:Bifunctional tail protein n=1 Tax=Shimwellia blattae (strain ATCC 29907 / DSM 4481 / JCM 1650 / NBRC 105725 / CDC 9005-74) TaxID=630626 RepID=I2B9Q3_SHIBC|nr:phage tailspike protein [Shimwellia blattae]AFJ47257.1 bifunctional tail protein [Shimwellia blattae DSM 4481 = NBRC 105725]GAB82214.1 hypothetical protein EB105725_21_00120 [Shimwellia blattae DSM 4481 = NBRC 105725]VDY64750.1 Head binding [Shimwellia blattae]VEC22849.1 Head binding [Shimwellia blattae]
MPDISANVVVSMPSQLFTLARQFKANANGKIYIGQIDTDPVNPDNQIQVYIENEDGSLVPVPQPIIINAGGYPVYNGQVSKFVTVKGHSMAVYDAYGTQQFYYPNIIKYDPDQFKEQLSLPSGSSLIGYKTSNVSNYLDSLTDSYVLVTDICQDLNEDNRMVIFSQSTKVFVPKEVSVRCNLLPTDDIRKFVGDGKVLTRDKWGTEHVFDVNLAINGPADTPRMRVNSSAFRKTACSIGVIGDSITDGVNTIGYTANPYDPSTNNLSSTNYNHMMNGGSNSWFRWFIETIGMSYFGFVNKFTYLNGYNAAHAGAAFVDGWAYRNLDYGFFQNAAYGKTMPDVVLISMGENDAIQTFTQETLIDLYDKFIRKCWGYGSTVAIVGMPMAHIGRSEVEHSVKATLHDKYNLVEYLDISSAIDDSMNNIGVGGNGGDAISMRNTVWDVTHPAQATHYRMGGYCAYIFSKQRFIEAIEDTKFLPVTHDKFIVETSDGDIGSPTSATSNPESIPGSTDSDTNNMTAKYVWWPYSSLNKAIYIRFMIWSDADQSIDLSTFYVTPSIYPTGTTKSIICRLSHQIRSDAATDPSCIASIGTEIEPVVGSAGYDYRTCHIARLKRGLNIFEVIHANAATYVALPMLYFNSAKGLGFSRNMAGVSNFVSGSIMSLDGQAPMIQYPAALTIAGRSYMDEAPDYYQCGKGSVVQTATFDLVNPLSNFSVVMRYKPSRSQYLIVDFTGSVGAYLARTQINGVNGLSTQTTAITDAQYNYLNAGGKFSVISKVDSTTIVFEDITATPSYVTILGGLTGGGMAVRRVNATLPTSFRCVGAGIHFSSSVIASANLNQTPV